MSSAAEVPLPVYFFAKHVSGDTDGFYQCFIAVNVTCLNVKQVADKRIMCAPWIHNYFTTNSVISHKG